MTEMERCPFCGNNQIEAPESCVCRSETLMCMSRKEWQHRPIEDELRAEIAALQSRLAALENGRPMETAPRDGTCILVETNDMFGKYFEIISWNAVANHWVSIVGDCDDDLLRWWPLPGSEAK